MFGGIGVQKDLALRLTYVTVYGLITSTEFFVQ